MIHTEALKMVLEALETDLEIMKEDWYQIDSEWGPSEGGLSAAIDGSLTGFGYFQKTIEAITAIKEALAQPPVAKPHEQEPVAYIEHHKGGDNLEWDDPGGKRSPLYTTPPQRPWVNATTWRGLSDDEALECWPGLAMYADCAKFWENIEAKLKEKNT